MANAFVFSTVTSGAFRGLLDTRTPLFAAVLANVVNILINYTLFARSAARNSSEYAVHHSYSHRLFVY
jgi:peptidoglycan biosynthesis protein MviN/MurJ (putative lipid II flippase)